MKSVKGTQTEQNLLTSFIGEGQARNRYTYYAKQAKKDGYEQIAAIFEETAEQESVHAKQFFKYLEGGHVQVDGIWPAGVIGSTEQNLNESVQTEHEENSKLYPVFAKIAEKEGFNDIADTFKAIIVAETFHEKRFQEFENLIKTDKVFKKDKVIKWRCRHCGYIHEGEQAPQKCPACHHLQAYFEILKYPWKDGL
jgi:rubrerythrin